MKKIIIIGSGFGGLSITSRLRSKGFDTTLIEKHGDLGGRGSDGVVVLVCIQTICVRFVKDIISGLREEGKRGAGLIS